MVIRLRKLKCSRVHCHHFIEIIRSKGPGRFAGRD
jgi:hypothetical protein